MKAKKEKPTKTKANHERRPTRVGCFSFDSAGTRYNGCTMRRKYKLLRLLAKNMTIVVGLVLIWRGIWYVLDAVDLRVFGGNHEITAVVGILVGLLLLYLPDGDLKEIEKL